MAEQREALIQRLLGHVQTRTVPHFQHTLAARLERYTPYELWMCTEDLKNNIFLSDFQRDARAWRCSNIHHHTTGRWRGGWRGTDSLRQNHEYAWADGRGVVAYQDDSKSSIKEESADAWAEKSHKNLIKKSKPINSKFHFKASNNFNLRIVSSTMK